MRQIGLVSQRLRIVFSTEFNTWQLKLQWSLEWFWGAIAPRFFSGHKRSDKDVGRNCIQVLWYWMVNSVAYVLQGWWKCSPVLTVEIIFLFSSETMYQLVGIWNKHTYLRDFPNYLPALMKYILPSPGPHWNLSKFNVYSAFSLFSNYIKLLETVFTPALYNLSCQL